MLCLFIAASGSAVLLHASCNQSKQLHIGCGFKQHTRKRKQTWIAFYTKVLVIKCDIEYTCHLVQHQLSHVHVLSFQ